MMIFAKCLGMALVVCACLCMYTGVGVAQFNDCTANSNCSSYNNLGICNNITGECSCENVFLNRTVECFRYNNETNFCDKLSCYKYFSSDGECREGLKSRTTALLLSIFLINFGAANFYIERYELAVPQIILGLVLCFFQFGSCAVACTKEDETSTPCIVCCSFNSLFSLLFLAWWLADLIIFAMNNRDDGDGCPLYT